VLDDVERLVQSTGERLWESEVFRLRGELLAMGTRTPLWIMPT